MARLARIEALLSGVNFQLVRHSVGAGEDLKSGDPLPPATLEKLTQAGRHPPGRDGPSQRPLAQWRRDDATDRHSREAGSLQWSPPDRSHPPSHSGQRGVATEPKFSVAREGWNVATWHLYSDAGTHMDAQIHFAVGDETIGTKPLALCLGPAWVVSLKPLNPRALLTVAHLGDVARDFIEGESLLLLTDWHHHAGNPAIYRDGLPRIGDELAAWCVARRVKLLGVEPPSIADANHFPQVTRIHQVLLGGGVTIVEGLAHLDQLTQPRVFFHALPLNSQAATAVRCGPLPTIPHRTPSRIFSASSASPPHDSPSRPRWHRHLPAFRHPLRGSRLNLDGQGTITRDLGLTDTQFGWVMSEFAIIYALFQTPSGMLADKIGRRFDPKNRGRSGLSLPYLSPSIVHAIADTPPETHLEVVGLAAARGITVICQKPIAPTWEESVAVVEAARRANVRLMIHENFRWQPWYREIRGLLDAGILGELFSINVRIRVGDGWQEDAYLARQPFFRHYPRLLVYEFGVHFLDTFRYLGGEISSVYARLQKRNPAINGEDAGQVICGFASGATAILDTSRYG